MVFAAAELAGVAVDGGLAAIGFDHLHVVFVVVAVIEETRGFSAVGSLGEGIEEVIDGVAEPGIGGGEEQVVLAGKGAGFEEIVVELVLRIATVPDLIGMGADGTFAQGVVEEVEQVDDIGQGGVELFEDLGAEQLLPVLTFALGLGLVIGDLAGLKAGELTVVRGVVGGFDGKVIEAGMREGELLAERLELLPGSGGIAVAFVIAVLETVGSDLKDGELAEHGRAEFIEAGEPAGDVGLGSDGTEAVGKLGCALALVFDGDGEALDIAAARALEEFALFGGEDGELGFQFLQLPGEVIEVRAVDLIEAGDGFLKFGFDAGEIGGAGEILIEAGGDGELRFPGFAELFHGVV